MSNTDITPPSGPDIYWESWVDAYSSDDIIQNASEIDIEDEELLSSGYDEEMLQEFSRPIKTIMTPFGILPLTEQSLASSHFKFWVGHSNFKLLKHYYPIIAKCRGVESVDILTPYRFRIAVGRLFRDREIMSEVRGQLLGVVNNEFEK